MKFLLKTKFAYLVIFVWIIFNVFFLPFAVWTSGIVRPWFVANGLVPYKDFTWFRTPFDIFLLMLWHSIFGFTEFSYQLFSFFLLLANAILLFLIPRNFFKNSWIYSIVFYIIFLFPLFINTEEGELLIGAFFLLMIFIILNYFKSKRIIWVLIAGLVSGLIYITKQNAFVIAGVAALSIMVDSFLEKQKITKLLSRVVWFISGAAVPIVTMSLYFLYKGALSDFLYYTVYFILGPYRRHQSNLIQGDGVLLAFAFLSILFPFTVLWKDTKLKPQIIIFLILTTFASLFSLLPSFLSYRAFPSFGIISIIAGILIWALLKREIAPFKKALILLSFLLFIFFASRYIFSYITFFLSSPKGIDQYIIDYGELDKKIANWIQKNTNKEDRIQSFSNEMIYVFSDRLPKHKYIEPFPYLLQPFDKTAAIFINNPPKIVVYDATLPELHKGLDSWGFISFMEKKYTKISYGSKRLHKTYDVYIQK